MILFDIETTGLDPYENALRVFGAMNTLNGEVGIRSAPSAVRERALLKYVIEGFELWPEVGGWNITEFDLWFLAVRAQLHGLTLFPLLPLRVVDPAKLIEHHNPDAIGKYGKPRMTVPGLRVTDLAYEGGKEIADKYEVQWSLQRVAEALGWKAVLPNFRGRTEPETATLMDQAIHCMDDLSAMAHILESDQFSGK